MTRATLTFDNGPTADVTPFVLDQLGTRSLDAYFCVVGTRLQEPGLAELSQRALQEGHRIVNHSLSHRTPLGEDPSLAHAHQEIEVMDELMVERLGEWGDRWFRPFGRGGALGPHVFSQAALGLFAQHEYSVLLWNSVPRDWDDLEGWVDTALADIAAREHTVVVLHDVPTGAMVHLPRFLDRLVELEVEITLELPDDCVAVRSGHPAFDLASLTT